MRIWKSRMVATTRSTSHWQNRNAESLFLFGFLFYFRMELPLQILIKYKYIIGTFQVDSFRV